MNRRKKRWPVLEASMLVLGVLFVSPCFLAVLNSFKTLPEIIQSPLTLPESVTFASYTYLFTGVNLARPMVNSLVMCVAVILSLVASAPMAAYSIMRRPMPTGRFLRVFFLAGLTIPFQIIMVPLLQQFKLMGRGLTAALDWCLTLVHAGRTADEVLAFVGIDFSYVALLLHYVSWGLPLCIFIYSGFMSTIPKELEESAAIDGCGPVRTFWRIIFPLLTPCTVTVIIFWGLWIWNDFMQAFIVVGPRAELVFVQLWRFLSDKYVKNWNHIFAGVVVLSLPVTLLYLTMQRRFIKGLTAGAIK